VKIVVASADDYGVAHLDLEGDPNCDYTTKVRIAGSEVNVTTQCMRSMTGGTTRNLVTAILSGLLTFIVLLTVA
jgi:hypothetical protein